MLCASLSLFCFRTHVYAAAVGYVRVPTALVVAAALAFVNLAISAGALLRAIRAPIQCAVCADFAPISDAQCPKGADNSGGPTSPHRACCVCLKPRPTRPPTDGSNPHHRE